MRRATATILVGLLAGCGPMTGVALDAAPPAAVATTSIAASTTPRSVSSAAPSPRPTATSEAPSSAFSAPQIQSLTEQLRDRRVFRHVIVGNMPRRERHSWLLSKDGRRLTLTCEYSPGLIGSGRPDSKPWYLLASVSFAATDVPTGKTWAPLYQREQLVAPEQLGPTNCADVGEQLALACRPATLQVHGPNAYLPEMGNEDLVRWKPSTHRPVAGLSCRATATAAKAIDFEFNYYNFPEDAARPMLFFSNDGHGIERLVYTDGLQYAGFREAVLTPFDGQLPPHLRGHAP